MMSDFRSLPGSMPSVDWENPRWWWICSPKTTPIPQLSWPGSVMGSTVSGVSSATPSKRKPSPWWNPTPIRIAPFLLLAQGHWHHGVIGIVAARLMERYQRPAALLAADGEGMMRASVRAPEGFAVDQALQACADHLDRFGGHPAAGGFTVKANGSRLARSAQWHC